LLTKQPQFIKNFALKAKKNIWVGVTITTNNEVYKIYPLMNNYEGLKFVSFEPLLTEMILPQGDFKLGIDWVIIGKLTGSRRVKLDKEWVSYLIDTLKYLEIPIFIKDNVKWHKKIQEFPK